jgi:DNA-binding winged helix-turn-helix (wHTH) protein
MSFCLRIFKVSSFGSGSGSNQMESSGIRFGSFRLDLRRRILLRDDLPVRLGGRPLDILCALAWAGGDVLTQDELMARLWSGYVIEASATMGKLTCSGPK